LLYARKATRKLITLEKDEFMKNILDKRQLSIKVTANSLYGQCGAKTSSFYEIDVAASTTATGRKLLLYAKRVVEETYGNAECQTSNYGVVNTRAEHVYGDSVAAYTPVYVRFCGAIDVCTIEALAEKYGVNVNSNKWRYCKEDGKQTKQVCEMMCGVETWSEKGWTRLHRVIRHVLAPHKKMMRVVTHTGIVDVTDDHSLILENGEEISPKNVEIGTKLLHHALPQPTYTNAISSCVTVEQARIMGSLFAADHDEEKVIPSIIINNTQEVRESFWNGMYDDDADLKNGYTRVDQKNQISAACICLLAQSIGWKTSLNTYTHSDKTYSLHRFY